MDGAGAGQGGGDRGPQAVPAAYRCPQCVETKLFSDRKDLANHIRLTHAAEKPFVCELCGRRFGYKTNLNAHKKKKHGVFPAGRRGQASPPEPSTPTGSHQLSIPAFPQIPLGAGRVQPAFTSLSLLPSFPPLSSPAVIPRAPPIAANLLPTPPPTAPLFSGLSSFPLTHSHPTLRTPPLSAVHLSLTSSSPSLPLPGSPPTPLRSTSTDAQGFAPPFESFVFVPLSQHIQETAQPPDKSGTQ